MIANGRPSPAKLRNAMSNPYTWNALKSIGLIPKETKILEGNINPALEITLNVVEDENLENEKKAGVLVDIRDKKKGVTNVG